MEVTEKWLGEIGGWAAMKAARGLVDAGMVSVQSAAEGLIRGLAGGGKMKFACGLRIRSRSDVDNLCTCPAARRSMMCEHSLAVALAWLMGKTESPPPVAVSRPAPQKSPEAPRAPKRVPGQYSVFLPETILKGELREPVSVYIKFAAGGEAEESLLAGWLAEQGVQAQSAPLSLGRGAWPEFLKQIAGHPRVSAGRPSGGGQSLAVADAPVQLPVMIEAAGGQDVIIRLEGRDQHPISRGSGWWLCRETHTIFTLPTAGPDVEKVLQELTGPVRRTLPWLVAQRGALGDVFQVSLKGAGLENFHVAPVPCEFEALVDGSFQAVEVTLTATYQDRRWGAGSADEKDLFPIQDQQQTGTFYVQDRHGESRFLSLFESLGFKPAGRKPGVAGEVLRLTGTDAILSFYATDLPRIQKQVKIVEGDRWRAATRGVARIVPQVRPQAGGDDSRSVGGGDWLSMEFGYEAPDGFRLPRAEVLRLVRSGQRSVQAKNGKRYLVDLAAVAEFEDVLQDVPLQLTPDGARLNALHAPYFFPEGEALLPKLGDEAAILAELGDLGPRLRPYQLLGTRWMQSLVLAGRGGILGDEMGLGKTVQSIAVIRALVQQATPETRQPVLIVCPKSLVGNWRAEIERFAPELKVAAIQGAGREERLKQMSAFDVIITTYQLIIRDLEYHNKREWALILLDEASYIRNPDTEAAKALRSLRARTRLALTGTPVENGTRDLWSIYQFVLPGYLGSRETFKERFEQPIHTSLDTPAGQAASQRLKKLIRPYFLRRTKREVLRDLPEKIEQVLWCDPSSAQMEVYRRLLEEGREEIKAARKRSGQNGAKMTMFTVLLRLRQACCDLRLTGIRPEALAGLDLEDLSGKWPMLMERLDGIIDGGGKVLVFSQFVQFLRLVRERLDGQNTPYCYLDGSSQDRDAQVIRFQTDPSRRVFLISLKAGGYGLNLTAADHVILLDPWWNPAVEAQAIDRAHRIGQQRVVTAYRLAIRGTVEERILALQARKRGLIEAAMDEQSPLMAGLQMDD
ncbi:MAG: SNF2-related protein, partial [Prosthecobacter sp.]|nr:SNF2-related protein [Prosthecobacter sp.]